MKTYLDSSVVLRVVLGEPNRLPAWPRITEPVASELIRVECLRTIDRSRARWGLPDDQVEYQRAHVRALLQSFVLIPLDRAVLDRAAEPFPTALGSLDAIHLATAMSARGVIDGLVFATHDDELAQAASSVGFQVHT